MLKQYEQLSTTSLGFVSKDLSIASDSAIASVSFPVPDYVTDATPAANATPGEDATDDNAKYRPPFTNGGE